MRTPRGFTLVELLVTIGLIAVLVGLLLPVVARARTASGRVACGAQLADVGRALQMYLNDSENRLPWVNPVPSAEPPIVVAPSINETLARYTSEGSKVWRCPADAIRRRSLTTPAGYDTYFEREGGSIEVEE